MQFGSRTPHHRIYVTIGAAAVMDINLPHIIVKFTFFYTKSLIIGNARSLNIATCGNASYMISEAARLIIM